jgi:hypothetical protein
VSPVGAGLKNMGNTCFLNSVLQCLAYTPPLANYLLSGDHSRNCAFSSPRGPLSSTHRARLIASGFPGRMQGFCLMCEVERTLRRALVAPKTVVRPESLVYKLKRACLFFLLEFYGHTGRLHFIHTTRPFPADESLHTNTLVIAKNFKLGQQQDAHECLRYLLGGMEDAVLHGRK